MESPRSFPADEWARTWDAEGGVIPGVSEWLRQGFRGAPFLVGVCGSVSVGKSTFCAALAEALRSWGTVDVVSTDSFLFANRELESRAIMHRKGFPESYDEVRLNAFFDAVRRRETAEIPLYSHEVYDVTSRTQRIEQPDVVVLEGVAALHRPELLDRKVFLDAEEPHIEAWYLNRVLELRDAAKPGSFYWHFRDIARDEFADLARRVWQEVNHVNLHEHILPKREVADLVLHKGADHSFVRVSVRD